MSAPTTGIDWDEAERRERRRDLAVFPGLAAFFVGIVLLTGGYATLHGAAAWAVIGALLAVLLLVSAASHLVPRLRARSSPGEALRISMRPSLPRVLPSTAASGVTRNRSKRRRSCSNGRS